MFASRFARALAGGVSVAFGVEVGIGVVASADGRPEGATGFGAGSGAVPNAVSNAVSNEGRAGARHAARRSSIEAKRCDGSMSSARMITPGRDEHRARHERARVLGTLAGEELVRDHAPRILICTRIDGAREPKKPRDDLFGIGGLGVTEHLEGDPSTEPRVVCEMDGAEASSTNRALDPRRDRTRFPGEGSVTGLRT